MHRVLVPRTRASRPAQTKALEHSLIGRDFSGDDRDIEAGCSIPGQPHLDVVIAGREQKRRARGAEVLHGPGEDAQALAGLRMLAEQLRRQETEELDRRDAEEAERYDSDAWNTPVGPVTP